MRWFSRHSRAAIPTQSVDPTSTDDDAPAPAVFRQHPVLIQRSALDGLPLPSEHWHAFDHWDDLCAHATQTPHASVLLLLTHAAGAEPLAAQLHALQHRCKGRLKIILRISATIGEFQRRLLSSCGAALLLPQALPLPRICELLAVTTAQTWQIHLPDEDFATLLHRLRPPPYCGRVEPNVFRAAVAQIFSRADAAAHTCLRLRPRGVLTAEHCLQQMRFER